MGWPVQVTLRIAPGTEDKRLQCRLDAIEVATRNLRGEKNNVVRKKNEISGQYLKLFYNNCEPYTPAAADDRDF